MANLITADRSWHELPGSAPSTTRLILAMVTPSLVIASLLIATWIFDGQLGSSHLILVLLVFSLTFPGRIPDPEADRLTVITDILTHWGWVAALLLALGWVTHTISAFDQRALLLWMLVTPLLLSAAHLSLPLLLSRLMAADGVRRIAVIAGGGELARRLELCIGRSPLLGISVAGYFDDRAPERLNENTPDGLIGGLDHLPNYVRQHHVDLIYINLPMTSQPRILKLLDELRDTTASIYFVPDIFLFNLIQARMDTISGIPVLAVCETPFYGADGMLKRASDLILGAIILLLISPLMVAIAIAVKFSSPGPVIFAQRRYGLDGHEITVYKFRSMTVCEDGNSIRQATQNDTRVTKLGAFLRSSSLDELPQFINVMQGRMSIVGPRPHAVAHNEMYRKLIDGYMIRHKVRPGITGLAQVNGQRGETDTLDKMQARIDYDHAYLRNWSLRLDLQIIIKTLFVVWKKQNAY